MRLFENPHVSGRSPNGNGLYGWDTSRPLTKSLSAMTCCPFEYNPDSIYGYGPLKPGWFEIKEQAQ